MDSWSMQTERNVTLTDAKGVEYPVIERTFTRTNQGRVEHKIQSLDARMTAIQADGGKG